MPNKIPKTINFPDEPKELIGIRAGQLGYKKTTYLPVHRVNGLLSFKTKHGVYLQDSSQLNKFRLTSKHSTFGFSDEKWIIYTREGCPYCDKAKEVLLSRSSKKNCSVKIIDGKKHMNDVNKQMKRVNREDFKTWPKIFLNNDFVGGFSDLENKLKLIK